MKRQIPRTEIPKNSREKTAENWELDLGNGKGGNETAQAFNLEKCNVVSSHSGFVSANSGQLLPMTFLYPNYNTLVYRGSFPKSRESFWSEKRRKTSRRWRVKPGLRFFSLGNAGMEPEEESGCMRGTYQMILFASLLKSASLIFRNHSESGHPGWFCLHVLSSRFSQLLLNLDTAGTLNRRKSLVSHFKIQAKCARPWERLEC